MKLQTRPLRTSLARLTHLTGVGLAHGLTLGAERIAGRPGAPAWLRTRVGRLSRAGLSGPERLRTLFEEMGGTFVKFGQMLALQPDLISLEYCNALFKLLDRVEPFPYSEVQRIWTEEIGRPPEDIFDSINREPLATASVGQVHVAMYDGRKVAVKVQRPNVPAQFGSDIRMMMLMIRLIEALRLSLLDWMVEPLTEFVGWTREELDYRYEARYGARVRRYAENNPAQEVPKVYSELTTRRTLVADFLNGSTLIAYLRAHEAGDEVLARHLEPQGFDRKRFAANVIDNFLGDAFTNGIYHADLHPANLLLLEGSAVGYIDFGITGVMSRHGRRHLVAMTLALAEGDMDLLCERFLEIAAYHPAADPVAFRHGLDRLAREWYQDERGSRKMQVNFTRIMGDMLTLSRQTRVLPERDIVKYIRSAIAIDGLVTRFEPDFDVGHYLAVACSRFLLWQGRREQLAPERFLDAAAAGGKLLRHGPARVSKALDRLADGSLLGPSTETPPRADALAARALGLSGAMLAVALLVTFTSNGAGIAQATTVFGLNLWTVELGFLSVAAVLLFQTVLAMRT